MARHFSFFRRVCFAYQLRNYKTDTRGHEQGETETSQSQNRGMANTRQRREDNNALVVLWWCYVKQ